MIAVQPEGIGTITHTLFLKSTTIESLEKFETTRQNKNEGRVWRDFFSEAKWREASTTMGESVTFQSLQRIKKRGWEGVKVVYSFSDVSKLTLKMRFPSIMSLTEPAPPADLLTFRFAAAAAEPAKLTIVMPPYRTVDNSPAETDGSPPKPMARMAQAKWILDAFRASIVLDVNGRIVNTDADYVSGSRVPILSVDFNQMMSSSGDFELLGAAIDGPLPPDIRERMKATNGLAMQVLPEVNVVFRRK